MKLNQIKSLFKNKWIEVLEKTTEKNGTYYYTHSPWSNGKGVAILPYIAVNNEPIWYLGRYETCPAHNDYPELCSITGGCDVEGEAHTKTVLRELHEESGYDGQSSNIRHLGVVRPSKSSDTIIYLFAIELDINSPIKKPTGDGTLGEVDAYCKWITEEDVIYSKDPLLSTMLTRLKYELDQE